MGSGSDIKKFKRFTQLYTSDNRTQQIQRHSKQTRGCHNMHIRLLGTKYLSRIYITTTTLCSLIAYYTEMVTLVFTRHVK